MHTYLFLTAGALLLLLFAWRIGQLIKLHRRTQVDPAPEILGPKEVHRHRL